jgi:tetratricopeptide (TPR) repeat protein
VAGLTYPEQLIQEIRPFLTGHEDVSYSTLRDYVNVEPEDITPGATTFDSLDPIRNLRLIIAANTTYEKIADYAYRKYSPDLLAIYLDMVDTVCHLFIKHMEPPTSDVSPQDAAKYGAAVAAAYAHTDSLVGKWMEAIDGETTIVLISDHGFKSGPIRPAGPSAIGGGQAIKWHRLTGAIALYGHRIKKGAKITDASVLDVAPTILRLLGLPAADDMPGRTLEEAFDEGWLASSSLIGTVETYGARSAAGTFVRRKDEEKAILERLKALGYVGRGSIGLKRVAASHFANQEFDKAIEIWQDVLEEEPGNAEILTAIANALIHKGSVAEAVPVLKDAVEQDPDFLGARNMLAICYINLNRLDDAAEISRQVLSEDPKNAEAYFNLGVIANLRAAYDQALVMFKRSTELRPDYDESRINLANEYFRRGDFQQAKGQLEVIRCYRQVIDRSPGFNPARISLSITLVSEGQLEEARRILEDGLEYPQDLHVIHTNLGIIERKMRKPDAAEKHFKRAIEIDEYYLAAHFDLVDLYIAEGEKDRALKQLDAILRVDPANDRARLWRQDLR